MNQKNFLCFAWNKKYTFREKESYEFKEFVVDNLT